MPLGLAVALAGAAGALARYGVDTLARSRLSPGHQTFATLAVNVTGSLLLGYLIGAHPGERLRVVVGVGLLASFTTFSTLVAQTYRALDDAQYVTALALPALSVLAGLAMLAAGVALGRLTAG